MASHKHGSSNNLIFSSVNLFPPNYPHSPSRPPHNLLIRSRHTIGLDGFADGGLGDAAEVHVCCIPGVNTAVVGGFQEGEGWFIV